MARGRDLGGTAEHPTCVAQAAGGRESPQSSQNLGLYIAGTMAIGSSTDALRRSMCRSGRCLRGGGTLG